LSRTDDSPENLESGNPMDAKNRPLKYTFVSDGSIPEPGSLVLLRTGLAALAELPV
jgi:hypothetical protein